jgi:hypothetical protein
MMMNRSLILSLLALSSTCHALCTRGPEGPKATDAHAPAAIKLINSSCVQFDGVVLCSSGHLTQRLAKEIADLAVNGTFAVFGVFMACLFAWVCWTVPGTFTFWLKCQFIDIIVLRGITKHPKQFSWWDTFVYWCVFASVWYSLDVLLSRAKRVWVRIIVPAWKDPASIASLKLE